MEKKTTTTTTQVKTNTVFRMINGQGRPLSRCLGSKDERTGAQSLIYPPPSLPSGKILDSTLSFPGFDQQAGAHILRNHNKALN